MNHVPGWVVPLLVVAATLSAVIVWFAARSSRPPELDPVVASATASAVASARHHITPLHPLGPYPSHLTRNGPLYPPGSATLPPGVASNYPPPQP